MSADTLDFELEVPREKAEIINAEIKKVIKEAENVSGVKSGIIVEVREPITKAISPVVVTIMVSMGTLFVTKFVTKYAETIAEELGKDTAKVIREANKSFLEWLKKEIGLRNSP